MTDQPRDPGTGVDAMQPVDPDIALIADWLGNELPPDRDAEVTRRLETDYAFYQKVAPIMKIWHLPVDFRELVARAEADTKPRPSATERTASPLGYEPPPPRHIREVSPAWVLDTSEERAMPAFALGTPEERAMPALDEFTERRLRRDRIKSTLLNGGNKVLKIAAVLSILIAGPGRLTLNYAERPHDITVAQELDRAPIRFRNGLQVETGSGELKEIPLAGGARLVVRPGSRFTYAYIPLTNTLSAALDGEATIELNEVVRYASVETSAGRVLFTPGSFAVRCEAGCAAMLVTVGAGVANIRGDSGKGSLTLKAGEKGRVPKHGRPEKVESGEGWPVLQPAKAPEGGTSNGSGATGAKNGRSAKSANRGR
jgi:hypothetical protein